MQAPLVGGVAVAGAAAFLAFNGAQGPAGSGNEAGPYNLDVPESTEKVAAQPDIIQKTDIEKKRVEEEIMNQSWIICRS